jgi:hypothetical protein
MDGVVEQRCGIVSRRFEGSLPGSGAEGGNSEKYLSFPSIA